jgi:hypothetical protein
MFRLTLMALLACAGFAQNGTKSADIGTNVGQPVVDYYDSISDYFRYSRRAVDLIAKKGIAPEDIPAVLTIAKYSRLSANQVIDARKAGQEFREIATKNSVRFGGVDVAAEANIVFLSEYHGRPAEEIRAMHDKGASFIDINQQLRRVGMKPRTERPATGR